MRGFSTLLIFALALRVGWVLHAVGGPQYPDTASYQSVVDALLHGGGFAVGTQLQHNRPPLFPLFWAALQGTFGASITALLVAQALLSTVTAALVGRLVINLGGSRRAALLAVLFTAVDPFQIFFCSLALAETLYVTLATAALERLAVASGGGPRGTRAAIAAGVAMALACLTRSAGLPVALSLALVPALAEGWRGALVRGGAYLGAFVLVLSPWTLRNAQVYRTFVPVAIGSGFTLYESNNELFADTPWPEGLAVPEPSAILTPLERDRYFGALAWRWIRQHPGAFAHRALRRIVRLMDIWPHAPGHDSGAKAWASALYMIPLYGLALMGLIAGARSHRWVPVLPLLATGAVHLFILGSVRYRLPLMPSLAVLGALGMDQWWRGRWRRREADGDLRCSVLVLVTDLALGGTPRSVESLVLGLDRTRFKATVVTLLAPSPITENLRNQGIEVLALDMRHKLDVIRLIPLVQLLWNRPFDVLHGWLFHANMLGRLLGRLAGIPVVLSSERGVEAFKGPLRVALDGGTAFLADGVVVNARAIARVLVTREKMDPASITVIPNGVDLGRFPQAPWPPETPLRLLCVARLDPVKAHLDLISIMPRLSIARPGVTLSLVGEGPERGRLEARVQELNLDRVVTFAGARTDVSACLAQAHVFVLPSLSEGMPGSVLEAMATGRPVVATSVGGTPELVDPGVTGLLVPPGDRQALAQALEWLLGDPARMKAWGQSGRDRVERVFNRRAFIESHQDLYTSMRDRLGV